MSGKSLVSSGTRLSAAEAKATHRPSAEIDGVSSTPASAWAAAAPRSARAGLVAVSAAAGVSHDATPRASAAVSTAVTGARQHAVTLDPPPVGAPRGADLDSEAGGTVPSDDRTG